MNKKLTIEDIQKLHERFKPIHPEGFNEIWMSTATLKEIIKPLESMADQPSYTSTRTLLCGFDVKIDDIMPLYSFERGDERNVRLANESNNNYFEFPIHSTLFYRGEKTSEFGTAIRNFKPFQT